MLNEALIQKEKMMTLKQLQAEVKEWTEHNFPNAEKVDPVLGVAEETGELCHAILKMKQGIRISEDHVGEAIDAIGDIVIYLADVCNKYGFDLESVVYSTWAQVHHRDWLNDPEKGNDNGSR